MDQEILMSIAKVINTLNTVTVNGKQNMMALVGSIGVLEDVYTKLAAPLERQEEAS